MTSQSVEVESDRPMKRGKMTCLQKIIFLLFILCCCSFYCESAAEQKKLKSKRINSLQKIQRCEHWKFDPADDPHMAQVKVHLHNDDKATRKLSVALKCNTAKKLREPSSPFKIKPGKTMEVSFTIAVDHQHIHHESSVRQQRCLLATWTDDGRLFNCRFNIKIWPNGLFYYKCNPYQKGQLEVKRETTSKALQINLRHVGARSFYIANSTCKPTVPTLQHSDLYRRLKDRQKWALEFPRKCSGAINMNYKGNCSVTVFHVCRITTTIVWEDEFEFHDGEVEECEHVKSSISVYQPGALVALWGTSEESSIGLATFIVFEIAVILGTIALIILYQRRRTFEYSLVPSQD